MTDKACCITWMELAPELQEAKFSELEALRSESNLPKSMFSLLYRTLENMTQHCPCCGSSLNSDAPLVMRTKPEAPSVPAKKIVTYPCGKCRGTGHVSGHGTDDPIKCMACLGEGKIRRGQNTTTDDGDLVNSGVIKSPEDNA